MYFPDEGPHDPSVIPVSYYSYNSYCISDDLILFPQPIDLFLSNFWNLSAGFIFNNFSISSFDKFY